MKINEILWPESQIEHIALHDIQPEEVEEICFGTALILRAKAEGKNPVYYVLGQTEAGRHLFCVIIQFPNGKGYPVTARTMTLKERRRFDKWKRK